MTRVIRLSISFVILLTLEAQTAKRPLTHKDYDGWRTIQTPVLSRDGKFLAYAYMPYDADGELVVREVATGKEWREGVGTLPPPPVIQPSEMNPDAEPPRRSIQIRFTSDSTFVVATTPGPARLDRPHAAVLRSPPERRPGAGVDEDGHPVPRPRGREGEIAATDRPLGKAGATL